MLETPPLRLLVNGKDHRGWTSISVDLGLDRLAGTFDLGVTSKWVENEQPLSLNVKAGNSCRVMIGDEAVIDGYIDVINEPLDTHQHEINISGRDKTGDLVDCSAPVKEFTEQTLDQLASALASPFGIKVVRRGDIGAVFRRFVVNPGDTVADCLDRLARQRGAYAYTDGTGRLIVGDIPASTLVGKLVLGKNLESITPTEDMSERYSSVTVVSQHDNGDDWNDEQDAITGSATALDKTVTRHRPLIIVAETQGEGATLLQRANWEVRNRKARALSTSAKASGWLNPQKKVWRPGQTVEVEADAMHATGTWIVNTVRLLLDDQGSLTHLSLLSPAALERLDAHAKKAKKEDTSW